MASFANRFAKTLSGNDILVPHLNAWFAFASYPDEIPFLIRPNKPKDDAFHPSSALRCARAEYADRCGALPHQMHSADSHKNFMVGHMYHSFFQWILVEQLHFATWPDIERHFYYTDKDVTERTHPAFVTEQGHSFDIRGSVDVSHCVIPGHGTYLVDIKTVNSTLFSGYDLPGYVLAKYMAQVKIYLEFVDLDTAIILCIEKDSPHRFKEILVQRDPVFVDEIVEKWETVADALITRHPPECTCDIPSKCVTEGLYNGGQN